MKEIIQEEVQKSSLNVSFNHWKNVNGGSSLFLQSEKNYQVQGKPGVPKWDVTYPEDEYIFGDFTERLWAYLTIQQLLDKRFVQTSRLTQQRHFVCEFYLEKYMFMILIG